MITARLGRFCFRHRWWILAGWLGVIIAGSMSIGPLFGQMGDTNQLQGTETGAAQEAIEAGIDRGVEYFAVVDDIDATADATVEVLERAVADVTAITGVRQAAGPAPATDGRAAVITVTLAPAESQFEPFTASRDRLRELATELPGATVEVGGGDLISEEANQAIQDDLTRAELISIPLTVVILVFVFGGIIAAGLPAVAAIATMLGATAILLGFAQFVMLDANVVTVVTLLGLALSIDYGLLLVVRYREELAVDQDRAQALWRAWGTAGRTIMFSGLTVAAALTGMLAFDIPWLRALAAAGIATALVAMLASLTLAAALLRLAGPRIKASRKEVARLAAAAAAQERGETGQSADAMLERGFFARLAAVTQRRPLLATLGCLVILLAIGSPLLGLVVKVPQLEALPRTLESVRVADVLESRFEQTSQPAVRVVARTDPATLDSYVSRWASDPTVLRVEPASALNPELSMATLAVHGDGQSEQARELVQRLREDRPAGYESWVTGDAAQLIDLTTRLWAGLPAAVAITVLAMLVLLFLMTGSVVIPVKAVLANAVSLIATFGVLTAVFQHGWLAGPLHTLTIGGLSPFMIVIVFAFAFGLSMDYEVFLLSRIKEYHDAGKDSDTAVRLGLQRSGRVITLAALLMLVVFACFAAARVGQIEQIGLGLFVAVLIDATLVRCLLVPSTMTLLGRFAWWAPGPLRRFHRRFGLHEAPTTTPPPVLEPAHTR